MKSSVVFFLFIGITLLIALLLLSKIFTEESNPDNIKILRTFPDGSCVVQIGDKQLLALTEERQKNILKMKVDLDTAIKKIKILEEVYIYAKAALSIASDVIKEYHPHNEELLKKIEILDSKLQKSEKENKELKKIIEGVDKQRESFKKMYEYQKDIVPVESLTLKQIINSLKLIHIGAIFGLLSAIFGLGYKLKSLITNVKLSECQNEVLKLRSKLEEKKDLKGKE
jgi:hypothetical protein